MRQGKGIVEYVKSDALATPDTYANLFKHSLKVRDLVVDTEAVTDPLWFNLSNTKSDVVKSKDDSGEYNDVLNPGSEIIFTFIEKKSSNGTIFRNLKISNVHVTKAGVAVASTAPINSPIEGKFTTNEPVKAPYVDKKLVGVKIGHAISNAVNLIGPGDHPNSFIKEEVKRFAKLILDVSEELAEEKEVL